MQFCTLTISTLRVHALCADLLCAMCGQFCSVGAMAYLWPAILAQMWVSNRVTSHDFPLNPIGKTAPKSVPYMEYRNLSRFMLTYWCLKRFNRDRQGLRLTDRRLFLLLLLDAMQSHHFKTNQQGIITRSIAYGNAYTWRNLYKALVNVWRQDGLKR
jgi:hypothetical protein